MNRERLTNAYYGQTIGTIISNNTIETSIGTYYVTDADIEWLRKQQSRKSFCVGDIKSVGQLYEELGCISETCEGCL